MEPDDLLCSRNARPEKRGGERPDALARRTREECARSDARSKGQPLPLPKEENRELEILVGESDAHSMSAVDPITGAVPRGKGVL